MTNEKTSFFTLKRKETKPMIKEATIYVSSFEETHEFYHKLMPQYLKKIGDQALQLTFPINVLHAKENFTQNKPYYHFAFRIPYHLFEEAKNYVKKIVPLNIENGKEDISFKEGIRSFYFYDPSGNIVECIAFEKIKDNDTSFTGESFKGLVEMSVVSHDTKLIAKKLAEAGIYNQPLEKIKEDQLNFIFSDRTVLLLSPVERKWVFSDKKAAVFPQELIVDDWKIEITDNKELKVKKLSK